MDSKTPALTDEEVHKKGRREIAKLAVNRTARHLARYSSRKIPLGLGAVVGGSLVASDLRKAKRAEAIAKDESRSESERVKAERELESALRSASLGALSTSLGTVPGVGTAAAIAVDALEFTAEAIDTVQEIKDKKELEEQSQTMQRAMAAAGEAELAAQTVPQSVSPERAGKRLR